MMTAGAAAWRRVRGGGDPHWANVVSYLRFNAADGSTSFDDERGANTWTAFGNAEMDDQFQLFGNNGILGAGDSIVCSTNWRLESQPFTLDISYRPDSISGNQTLFYNGTPDVSGNAGVLLRAISGNGLLFAMLGGTNVTATSVLTIGGWNRIRVCRDATNTRIYVGGTQVASGVQANGSNSAAFAARIGSYRAATFPDPLLGRVDEFRITMGVARTTSSSYVVESEQFPNFGP